MRRDGIRKTRLLATIVAAIFTLVGAACRGEDSHGCTFSGDQEWASAGLRIDVLSPDRCPIQKSYVGQSQQFSVNVFGEVPRTRGGFFALFAVRNGANTLIKSLPSPIFEDFYGRTVAGAQIAYPVGTASGPDRGIVEHPVFVGDGSATGNVTLSYNIPVLSQSMSASGTALIGSTLTYTVTPSNGRTPYTYQWYRDGVAIAGATGATYTYSTTRPESFRLSETTRSADGQSVTSLMDLNFNWSLDVQGPYSVRSRAPNCIWTAYVAGGVQPVVYQWRRNGTVVGGNSPQLFLTAPSSGSFTVSLGLTDGAANTKADSRTVTVSSSGDACTGF